MADTFLLTGGSGRLGSELRALLDLAAPSSEELDVTKLKSIRASITRYTPTLIVHAAAYTDVSGAEDDQAKCWQVNVEGTRNVVKVALEHGLPLIHISTDYVFYGDAGNYHEDAPLGPVRNTYALSKLVAEELVRLVPKHLVIRTSFRPREWPYPKAFDDVYTSQDYVDIIAPDVALAIEQFESVPYSTLHIATERKSVFELARRRSPGVERGSKAEVAVDLPADISLNTERWQQLKPRLEEKRA